MGVPAYLTTALTASGLSAINVSAGSTSSNVSAVTFSNANGVTFGFDGSNVSASVQTNYQTPGAYLTTAALSQDSSKYAGTNGSIVGGSFTLNTSGATISLPAYLTTAQPPGAYLTTAMASNRGSDFVQATAGFFGTNASGTIASNAISVSVAAPASGGAGTGFTTATTAGSNIVGTLSTNGLSMGVPAYLTTAGAATGVQSLNASQGQISISGSELASVINSHSTIIIDARSLSLDEVQDPANDAFFHMHTEQVQFQWGSGFSSFSTDAQRQGLFELDIVGGTNLTSLTEDIDALHIHQSSNNLGMDMVHIQGNGTRQTCLHLVASASIAAVMNQPIIFSTGLAASDDSGFAIGSVPMILGTTMSNSVANLNANYVQGKGSAVLAGTGFTTATTAGSVLVGTQGVGGLSLGVPAWLTTAATGAGAGVAISNSQTLFSTGTVALSAGGGAITIASSAGGQSLMFSVPQTSSLVGSGMISIATAGSTVNISAPNTSSFYGSGLTLSTNVSTISIIAPATSSLVGVGAVSLSTNGSTISISGVGVGTQISTATIAGNNITLSGDATGLTLGYPNFLTTAGAPVLSYWANMPYFPPTPTFPGAASGSALMVFPMVLPAAVSGGFMRFAGSVSFANSTVAGTSANTSFTAAQTWRYAINLMTRQTGLNSMALGYYTSTYASYIFQTSITAGNTGSNFTAKINGTFPQSGSYGNTATSAATTAASWSIPATLYASLSSQRWVDIPFAMSLSAGNYWVAVGGSTSTAANAGTAFGAQGMRNLSLYAQQQAASNIPFFGLATNSSLQLEVGRGSWSTNSLIMSTSSINLSQVSYKGAIPMPYVQIIRES